MTKPNRDDFPKLKMDGTRVYLPGWVAQMIDRSQNTIAAYMSGTRAFELHEDEDEIVRVDWYNRSLPFITEKGLQKILEYQEAKSVG